jgi:hypothetical protein
MAQYQHLPIYKATYDLLLKVTEATRHFPRDFKHSLAAMLREEVLAVVVLIYRANSARDKRTELLDQVVERMQVVELMLRLSASRLFALYGFRYNNNNTQTGDATMKMITMPPLNYLRECFDYNPDTGILTWRDRPDSHFETPSKAKRHRSLCVGKPVGTKNADGYLVVRMSHNGQHRLYRCHRIAYAILHGDTDLLVDHINGNRTDNRACNLRSVTQRQNVANMTAVKRRGLQGAFWDKSRGKWLAQIKRNYKSINLGRFDTEAEAHAAYCAAKQALSSA